MPQRTISMGPARTSEVKIVSSALGQSGHQFILDAIDAWLVAKRPEASMKALDTLGRIGAK